MKTIQERAREYVNSQVNIGSQDLCRMEGYIIGATEQKAIDIDKACEWFANYLFEIGYPDDWVRDNGTWMNGAARFRKAMEER